MTWLIINVGIGAVFLIALIAASTWAILSPKWGDRLYAAARWDEGRQHEMDAALAALLEQAGRSSGGRSAATRQDLPSSRMGGVDPDWRGSSSDRQCESPKSAATRRGSGSRSTPRPSSVRPLSRRHGRPNLTLKTTRRTARAR
jgi:hypothetical protein